MKKLILLTLIVTFAGCGTRTGEDQIGTGLTVIEESASPGIFDGQTWPVLKSYGADNLLRIALPLGGIGTGTVSLGGRGDLRDWEIMNRPAKGFTPQRGRVAPFFVLHVIPGEGAPVTRGLEGPLDPSEYEGMEGSGTNNAWLPRFRTCTFTAAYPFGQVNLSDPEVPVEVTIRGFNPLIPGDPDASGLPVAVLRYVLHNRSGRRVSATVCGNLPNFIGVDGWEVTRDWRGHMIPTGANRNRNHFRRGSGIQGIYMESEGVDTDAPQWGTIALTTTADSGVSHRTNWSPNVWGNSILDFWDDLSDDGRLEERDPGGEHMPMASLAVEVEIPAGGTEEVQFLLSWHFPNRMTWTPTGDESDMLGNYYTTLFADAWKVAEGVTPRIPELEQKTLEFVHAVCNSSLPAEVKEAALFNISTLRTQTCFRTSDGRFYGWEGSCDQTGCCFGSCTHVWNYEQATAFLFGGLARSMREVEFGFATNENGLMSFRVNLPLERARSYGRAAADGQMGSIMKMYRDWQLSGDDAFLRSLWPGIRRALEFCWLEGGWDADRDGIMEGSQHNTMDVEYYGPNPQMGFWYLGALRAAEAMASHLGEEEFAGTCREIFESGSRWIDENLFNGEYYEHQIRPPEDITSVPAGLQIGMGASQTEKLDFQLGAGCLVDQLVGQYMAHICGLGYLADPSNVSTTLHSIMKYNARENLTGHFNCMRSYALGEEAALLMASYPKERPMFPFPYFTEVMTGFEYTAAVEMLYEGMFEDGLQCIRNIRDRYDGRKRNPFNEAECGHHYARAMASWAAILALTGFHYSGVDRVMTFTRSPGRYFWSNGEAWGMCNIRTRGKKARIELSVLHGELILSKFVLHDLGRAEFDVQLHLTAGKTAQFSLRSG